MKSTVLKLGLIVMLTSNIFYSQGTKRSVNINIHKIREIGIFDADDVESITFGIGMGLPLSRFIKLDLGLCGLSIGGEDIYNPVIAGEAGLIEILPTKYISVYSSQALQPGLFRKDEENKLNCSFIANIGLELFNGFPISPFFEGGFLVGFEQFALRGGAGIKYSFR